MHLKVRPRSLDWSSSRLAAHASSPACAAHAWRVYREESPACSRGPEKRCDRRFGGLRRTQGVADDAGRVEDLWG